MNVGKIMTGNVQSIDANRSIKEAHDLMSSGGFRHVPVTEDGNLVGIVSERDVGHFAYVGTKDDQILKNLYLEGGMTVAEIMTAHPAILSPTDSLRRALEIAVEKKYGAFPVMDGSKLVGIVSTTDLMRACLAAIDAGDARA